MSIRSLFPIAGWNSTTTCRTFWLTRYLITSDRRSAAKASCDVSTETAVTTTPSSSCATAGAHTSVKYARYVRAPALIWWTVRRRRQASTTASVLRHASGPARAARTWRLPGSYRGTSPSDEQTLIRLSCGGIVSTGYVRLQSLLCAHTVMCFMWRSFGICKISVDSPRSYTSTCTCTK